MSERLLLYESVQRMERIQQDAIIAIQSNAERNRDRNRDRHRDRHRDGDTDRERDRDISSRDTVVCTAVPQQPSMLSI